MSPKHLIWPANLLVGGIFEWEGICLLVYDDIGLMNLLVPFVLKWDKNWTIREIISNLSVFPKIVVKSKIGGGSEILEKKVIYRSIFLRFENGWHWIVWKSNSIIYRCQNDFVSISLGGGGSLTFSAQQIFRGNMKFERLPPPNVVDTKSFWPLNKMLLVF